MSSAKDVTELRNANALMQEVAVGVNGERVAVDPPDMRQSIGWQFARMAMVRQESAEATRVLISETGCNSVRDIQVWCALLTMLQMQCYIL